MLKNLYKGSPTTFYCGCNIEWQSNKKLKPNTSNCGYKPRNELTKKGKVNKRAQRIEWEHVVPAWEFGHQLQCWQDGGRKACKKNPKFKAMEGDLHNLVPAIGEVNGDRSNYKFSMIEGEQRVYGQCDAEVNFKAKVFEPAPEIRGDIARTYFYFEKQYGLKISKQQKKLFIAWDKQDPVTQTECVTHERKAKNQGWDNPFVAANCS
ncbi:endonuclease [Pseudoalteromonas sp. McH1-7]|nr:endonuclease [Pseudoalteromonas sp. McH1-7]NUZ10079.1 endonuclease [Pseudoalteromonas sp. McH1-7]